MSIPRALAKPALQHVATVDDITTNMLWVHGDGQRFRVRGVFTTDADANAFMEENRDTGLFSLFGPFRIVANLEGVASVQLRAKR